MKEIKNGDFIRYLKCIYLVEKYHELENGQFRLEYYFRSQIKENAKMSINQFIDKYDWQFNHFKKANAEDVKFLKGKISTEQPDFNLFKFEKQTATIEGELNEKDCIEFLKRKGYLIYKQT